MRIVIAGVLAGLAMFVWAAIANTVLPLGELGIRPIPHEAEVMGLLKGAPHGIYRFPAAGMDTQTGPAPIVLLNYAPVAGGMGPSMVLEALSEIVQSLFLAGVVAITAQASFARRVGVAMLVGIPVAISTSGSYLIWYQFPAAYTGGYILADLIRYLLAGLVIAALVKPKAARA